MATKGTQTVRERSKTGDSTPKKRRVRSTAKVASKPFKAAGRGVKKAASPFSFLLKPFQTKTLRAVGRFLAKILLINYVVGSWQELRKVTWPDRKQTLKLTLAVFIFAFVFGAIIAVTDYGLDKLFRKILLS